MPPPGRMSWRVATRPGSGKPISSVAGERRTAGQGGKERTFLLERNLTRERLTSNDWRFIASCVIATLAFAAVTALLFQKAFPEASIEFKAGRGEARRIGERYLAARGLSVQGDLFAGGFDADETQKVFLERTLGLEKANRVYTEEVKLWRWQLRWFRPLRKEEVRVAVTPAGEVVGFRREIGEEAPGARLERGEARRRAEEFLAAGTSFRLQELTFVEASTEERAARRDHSFVWEKTGWKIGDATFRVQVDVLGDSVGVFRQYVRVPESWTRDYEKLRSKNISAGQVAALLYALTALAALFYLVRYTRLGDVPWKLVGVFSVVGAGLGFLNQLNSIPIELLDYDTTQSFTAFVATAILKALMAGVLVGAWVGLFAAGGEPLYRRRFPGLASLRRFFTGAGVGSRGFFRGILLGYALTAFFMAYQAVFYVVAARFGAWAPADIPYSNLLNTAFPWLAVLLTGFVPAVTEEFSSRMFSIPFYEKFLKKPVLALVGAGFVWGFMHAAYPNQPFYIRGVEVGLAGVAIGALMLRFGVFPLLVWHFTVDAVYTSMLLLRSGNLYFALSGAVCAGILLVPLMISIVLYRRRGGFRPEDDLTNQAEGFQAEAPPLAESAGPAVEIQRRPVPAGLVRTMLSALVLAILMLVIPTNYPPRDLKYPVSRGAAQRMAREFVQAHGADPDSYKVVTFPDPGFGRYVEEEDNLPSYRTDPIASRYVTEKGGLAAWDRLVKGPLPASLWTTRFVRPLVRDEWYVTVDPRRQCVTGFSRHTPEAAPGADLDEAAARLRASALLAGMGGDSLAWKPVAATSEKQPNRRDWTFVYADSSAAVAEAVPRLTQILHGDAPGGHGVTLHVPEDYVRMRTKSTWVYTLLLVVRLLVIAGLLTFVIIALIDCIRRVPVPWKSLFGVLLALGIPIALSQINRLPAFVERYPSEIPWNVFLITGAVGICFGILIQALIVFGALLVLQAARPEWRAELAPRAWPAQARHALVVALLGLSLGVLVDRFELLARLKWPALFSGILPPELPGHLSIVPFYDVVWAAVIGTFIVGMLLAGLSLVLRRSLRLARARWGAVLLICVALTPSHVHSLAEALVPTFFAILALAAAAILALRAARGNLLAYLAVLPLVLGGHKALELIQQPEPGARLNGIIAMVLLAAPLLGLVVAAWRGGRRPAA